MKTEEDIRGEVEATKRTIANYRNAYKQGVITKETLRSAIVDCTATIQALLWVLGENDRYD